MILALGRAIAACVGIVAPVLCTASFDAVKAQMMNQAQQQQYPTGVTQPRTPLGPGLSQFAIQEPTFNGLSIFVSSTVPASEVHVFSLASTPLQLAWLNPNGSAWEVVTLEPGAATRISCPQCNEGVQVSFYDGVEQRPLTWPLGSRWVLNASADNSRWEFQTVEGAASAQ